MATHDYHIAAERDVSGKVNRHILSYFIVLGLMLGATIIGLTIMYRFSVDYERAEKIGMVQTEEAMSYTFAQQSVLTGKRGILDGKNYVPIDAAMKRFVNDVRRAD